MQLLIIKYNVFHRTLKDVICASPLGDNTIIKMKDALNNTELILDGYHIIKCLEHICDLPKNLREHIVHTFGEGSENNKEDGVYFNEAIIIEIPQIR